MSRNYAKEYENYHSSPKQKKRRASRNAARRQMERAGKVQKGDGNDVHHTTGNPCNNSRLSVKTASETAHLRERKKRGKRTLALTTSTQEEPAC